MTRRHPRKHDGLPEPERILQALRRSPRGPLKAKELARSLRVPDSRYPAFRTLLRELVKEGRIYLVKGQRYALPAKVNLVVGRLVVTRSGDGFVVPEEGEARDVFVRSGLLGSAMDGDRVVARIEGRPRRRNPEGRVIRVLERAHATVVGIFHRTRGFGYVVPLDQRIHRDVLIPDGEEAGAEEGDVVVTRLVTFGDGKLNPTGAVDRVLGPLSKPGVDVLAILFGHGLPLEFPPGVEAAAESAVAERADRILDGRTDHTDLLVFTIDPEDAKDHDDALSIAPVGRGRWEVGIHIADVSFYVEPGGEVDTEAYRRGTSVYLVDRVVPMLPDRLSSDVCSLRPDENRAAVSLFVVLDEEGGVRGHRLERTLIRSRHRLSYGQVQAVLAGDGSVEPATDEALRKLAELARALRRRRLERGSLDFDLPEARVLLGPEGEPVDIRKVVQLESHRLIEDFMLLANEIVAREALQRRLPIPFRVHEPPSSERLRELARFLGGLGLRLPSRHVEGKDLQRVLREAEGRPEEALVSTMVLRSMSRARYDARNLGHFGLGAEAYTHFTSPIRRYPDLLVHRVVVRALIEGGEVPGEWGGEELEAAAAHASERETKATEAERDSVDLKKAEFMLRHLGDEFSGTLSNVTSFGFFVLLDEYFVEGLVHVNSLEDDYYRLRERDLALVGDRTGRRFRIGDRVRVQVSRVDLERRHIGFVLGSVRAEVA